MAHEATHLIRYQSFPNHASHPLWLANGLGTWAETVVLAELGILDGIEEDPEAGTDLRRVRDLRASGRMPDVRTVLAGGADDLEFYEVYSVHWLLFHVLAEERATRLRRWFQELRRTGGGGDFANRIAGPFAFSQG